MTSKTDDMMNVLHSMAWKYNRPDLQLELVQEGCVAWLESESKGEDRRAVEAWEAMNDYLSKSDLKVNVPLHEGTRTALKKIRSGVTWDETDKLSEKAFHQLYWSLKDLRQVSEEMPHAQIPDSEYEVFFKEAEHAVETRLGPQYRELFAYQYGPLGYGLQEISVELGLNLSKVKRMNQTLTDFLRSIA